jgi:hypothetical protein
MMNFLYSIIRSLLEVSMVTNDPAPFNLIIGGFLIPTLGVISLVYLLLELLENAGKKFFFGYLILLLFITIFLSTMFVSHNAYLYQLFGGLMWSLIEALIVLYFFVFSLLIVGPACILYKKAKKIEVTFAEDINYTWLTVWAIIIIISWTVIVTGDWRTAIAPIMISLLIVLGEYSRILLGNFSRPRRAD